MMRTLFIGLDGATFTVLDRLTSPDRKTGAVVMPFLRHLLETGTRAKLRSTPNPLTPPAWVSLMTGRTPGHHGVFDFLRALELGTRVHFTLYDARNIRTEMIWSIATRLGRRVVTLNFPIMAPPPPASGAIVPGFVPSQQLRRNTAPLSMFKRFQGLEGFDPKALAWDFKNESKAIEPQDNDKLEQWISYHLTREEQWFRLAEKLLRDDEPDLMAVMFDGTDKIQHQAWSLIANGAIAYDADERTARLRRLCHRYFANLDGYIRRLVALAGPDARVFLASDHGFTGSTEIVRINSYLEDRGYLAFRAPDSSEAGEQSWFAKDLDWSKTLAYCGTRSINGITIRVARKAGEHGVQPENYAAFRERLMRDLGDLRGDDGTPVIAAIARREDAFPGPAMEDAPDLTLTLRDFGFVSIANVRPVVQKHAVVVGTHHPDGILIGAGPGVAARTQVERRDIVDVAALLLYSLGLPVPEDFEGRVPEDFFTPQFVRANPVEPGPPTLPPSAGFARTMTAAEKAIVRRQLQSLGYMDE